MLWYSRCVLLAVIYLFFETMQRWAVVIKITVIAKRMVIGIYFLIPLHLEIAVSKINVVTNGLQHMSVGKRFPGIIFFLCLNTEALSSQPRLSCPQVSIIWPHNLNRIRDPLCIRRVVQKYAHRHFRIISCLGPFQELSLFTSHYACCVFVDEWEISLDCLN